MAANKVITGVCRVSYAHLVEPYGMEGQEPKYSAVLIFPKSDLETRTAIEKAIDKAIEDGVAKFGGKKIAKTSVHIIKDGDEKDDPIYAGSYYINVKSKDRPQIVDRNLQDIIDPEEIYSGMYARFSLTFYPYSFNNMRGISVAMGNIQKVADGERFSGKTKASTDFNDSFASNFNDTDFPFGN